MRQVADNDVLLSQYLLGQLSEEEQEAVEKRYLDDHDFYEELLVVETELIDAYAEGTLSEPQRASFENHFLRSPGRRARTDFAQAWMAYVARHSEAARPRPQPPALSSPLRFSRTKNWPAALRVAATILLILAGAWLVSEMLRLRTQVEQGKSQRVELEERQRETDRQINEERRHSQDLSAQLERERNERDQQTITPEHRTNANIITLILTPGLSRGSGEAKKLIIPQATQQVMLQAAFNDGSHESYRAVIRTVEGRTVWSRPDLKPRAKGGANVITLQMPASVFGNKDYILTLSGLTGNGDFEDVAEYSFNASRK